MPKPSVTITVPEAFDRRCVRCGTEAPPTNTIYSLISATHGWRLQRELAADGTRKLDWHCPKCWDIHKKKKTGTSGR